jgi:hypothetical protein
MFVDNTEVNNRFDYVPITEPDSMLSALPAGAYHASMTSMGEIFFVPVAVTEEKLVDLDTPTAVHVKREIRDFFNPEITERLRAARLKHRRGVILHGNAGTGKTSLVRAMFTDLITHGAVVLIEPDIRYVARKYIPAIRLIDPTRPIVLVFDEFHRTVQSNSHGLLLLLDGLTSPDHVMIIGTTNYMANIPRTLCQRPSRFSLVLEVPALPESARYVYVQTKYPMLDVEMTAALVKLTSAMALDFLEEACKLSVMGYSIEDISARFAASSLRGTELLAEGDLDAGYDGDDDDEE